MRELEKNSPVPVRKEMSMTEYAKLVDTNADLVDKIKEQQEIIKGMQENEESAIKVMKMYEDYKLRVDKSIEKLEYYNSGEALYFVPVQDIIEILKGVDKQ